MEQLCEKKLEKGSIVSSENWKIKKPHSFIYIRIYKIRYKKIALLDAYKIITYYNLQFYYLYKCMHSKLKIFSKEVKLNFNIIT